MANKDYIICQIELADALGPGTSWWIGGEQFTVIDRKPNGEGGWTTTVKLRDPYGG